MILNHPLGILEANAGIVSSQLVMTNWSLNKSGVTRTRHDIFVTCEGIPLPSFKAIFKSR